MTRSVDKLHPNRFRDLYMGVRRRINNEPSDHFRMLTKDFNNRAIQINELDQLILRWEDHGGLMFDLEGGISEHLSSVGETPLDGLPNKLFYVHFGERAGLRFSDDEGFVDGMYVEPVAEGVEVTFVCNEPRWQAMETGAPNDCLIGLSRTANGLILTGETFNEGIRKNGFRGDLSLIHSLYQDHVLDAANFCLAAICAPLQDEDPGSEDHNENKKAPRLH